jgi:DNA replication protein DnaC
MSPEAQVYLQQLKRDLEEKIKASGRPTMTHEEYLVAQAEQFKRAMDIEKQTFKFDPLSIGLCDDEMSLKWDAVKPGYSDGIKAVEVVKPALKKGFGLIYLWGSYGQAKTLIGKILIAQAHAIGKKAAYANIVKVLDDIRLAYDERENKTTELLRRIQWWVNRDVLFIDELDKANETDWARERIFQLLDSRYTRAIREESLTVIASNGSDRELDGYLKSRLQDCRVGPIVHLEGADGRLVMPKNWKH